jgi:HNH endonuclease
MHNLILGAKGVDHVDHDTLNNQRDNLRPATKSQNSHNQRPRSDSAAGYKGVSWLAQKNRWKATIHLDGKARHLGFYVSDIEAALAYDAAASETQGAYAFLNFPDGVPQALRDQLRTEREAAEALIAAEGRRVHATQITEWWAERIPVVRTCRECGREFFSRGLNPAAYCGKACSSKAWRQRQPERERLETRTCTVCGKEYQPRLRKSLYCSPKCKSTGGSRLRRQREREAELEGRLF